MTWSAGEIQYEGSPLLLRKPELINIWDYKHKLTKLVCIEHLLEKIFSNGLPEKQYNSTLSEFDHYMCSLFDKSNDGVIFLIETYNGRRNYYYYTMPDFTVDLLLEVLRQKFKVNLESWTQDDTNWGFLGDYPVTIFPK